MRHKEIKWLAQCPGSLWSSDPSRCNLAPAISYFCWVVEVSDHTQEASYHQQLVWPSPGARRWARGETQRFFPARSQCSELGVLPPEKGGPGRRDYHGFPESCPGLLFPTSAGGNRPAVSKNELALSLPPWGTLEKPLSFSEHSFPMCWWVQTPEKGCDHPESHS